MKQVGLIIIVLGLLGLCFSYSMNTTVTTESKSLGYGIEVPSMTVNNIGLIEDRRNAMLVSGIATIIGVILFVAGTLQEGKIEPLSTYTNYHRKCPFCAELIKEDAVICRFCNRDLPAYIQPTEVEAEERGKVVPYPKICNKCGTRYPEEHLICPDCDLDLETL